MPLPSSYQRRQHTYLFIFKFFKDVGHNFFLAELHHLSAGVVAVRLSHPCIQQTKKIIYLCNRTNCTAGIFVGCFLFNGNNWR